MNEKTNARPTSFSIFDKIVSKEGVYTNMFWKELLNGLIYNRAIAFDVEMLDKVYGYLNAPHIFKVPIDRDEFKKLTAILMNYREIGERINEEGALW